MTDQSLNDAPEPATISATEMLDLYRMMTLIGAVDERIRAEVRSGTLQAATYPVRGLEAACAALSEAMRPEDQLVSTYRSIGDALAKRSSLTRILAEVFGRASGVSKGKGGTMHLHDQEAGFVTSTGIVGSGLPIAVGLGLAAQLDGDGRAVIVTFGDGATSIGAFHESLNMAALWKLPVVFVCQNNQWAEYTPLVEHAGSTDLAARAASYGMTALRADGFDPLQATEALRSATGHARAGQGPVFVEVETYRLASHSGVGDNSYVPQEELDTALARDPIPTFRTHLIETGAASEQGLERLEATVEAEVTQAFREAMKGPFPDPRERYVDVFAGIDDLELL